MKSQLFIPEKIKVGYQERKDTYTKKLAYIIYYDKKGVLRKEASWKGWIDKGSDGRIWKNGEYIIDQDLVRGPLPTHDFDNVPTEGFVLNKKAGGYSSGWNHRQTYCRVYDPRGFEFEITIPNLLYILQETNSYKGKGLEGTFVYSWDGKDLVLLPTTAIEYKESEIFTELQGKDIKAIDLVPGCSYKTKKQEEYIYLGRFIYYSYKFKDGVNKREGKKEHIFYKDDSFSTFQNLKQFSEKTTDTPIDNYNELLEKFSKTKESSKIVSVVEEDIKFQPTTRNVNNSSSYYEKEMFLKLSENVYQGIRPYTVNSFIEGKYRFDYSYAYYKNEFSLNIEKNTLTIKDPDYNYNGIYFYSSKKTEMIMPGTDFLNVYVILENGMKIILTDL